MFEEDKERTVKINFNGMSQNLENLKQKTRKETKSDFTRRHRVYCYIVWNDGNSIAEGPALHHSIEDKVPKAKIVRQK